MTKEDTGAERTQQWLTQHQIRLEIVEPDWLLRLQCGQVIEVPPAREKRRRRLMS